MKTIIKKITLVLLTSLMIMAPLSCLSMTTSQIMVTYAATMTKKKSVANKKSKKKKKSSSSAKKNSTTNKSTAKKNTTSQKSTGTSNNSNNSVANSNSSLTNSSNSNSAGVWIPNTGKKYHSKSSCSRMKSPRKVSLEEAKRLGYGPCSKCMY